MLKSRCAWGVALVVLTWSTVASAQADLRVTALTATVSDRAVTYKATVCNLGSVDTSTTFTIALYYHRTSAPPHTRCSYHSTLNNYNATVSVLGGLKSSACTTRTFTRADATTGTFLAWARADSDCKVTELDEQNNTRSATYTVNKPDLYIKDFRISVAAKTVTYTMEVCNRGTSAVVNYRLGVYYHATTTPRISYCRHSTSINNYNQSNLIIGGLDTGRCKTQVFTRPGAVGGAYIGWAGVDLDCKVGETDEVNNLLSSKYAVEKPELFVKTLTVTVSGRDATYSTEVCNSGTATTSNVLIALYHHRTTEPRISYCRYHSSINNYNQTYLALGGLKSGACVKRTFTQKNAPGGALVAWVGVDAGCAVAEGDETNNTKFAAYAVGKPDLYVTSLTTSVAARSVTYTARVCNRGTAALKNFQLGFYYHHAKEPTVSYCNYHSTINKYNATPWVLGGLASGACKTVTHTQSSSPGGSFIGWAAADVGCTVAEGDEANNTKSATYGVDRPDLRVKSFTVSAVARDVTYNVEVCNTGQSTTTNFLIGVYYNSARGPLARYCSFHSSYNAYDQSSWVTGGLAKGACVKKTFTRKAAAAGSFVGWARADAHCGVAEGDEVNNIAAQPYTVAKPDLYVKSLDVTVKDRDVTYTANVCNRGTDALAGFRVAIYYDETVAPRTTYCSFHSTYNHVDAWKLVSTGLKSGACTKIEFKKAKVPTGKLTAWARADSACTVGEADEGNNLSSKAYTVGETDLHVSSFKVTAAQRTVTYAVEICNKGAGTTDNFIAALYYQRTTTPTHCGYDKVLNPYDEWAWVSGGLASGKCVTKTFTRKNAPGGSHVAWTWIDSGCTVKEDDEKNNHSSAVYRVSTLPDLHVTKVDVKVSGQTATYTATACNQGVETKTPFTLALYHDRTSTPACTDATDASSTISGLAATLCVTKTFRRTGAPLGSYRAWVTVDAACKVTENDEANNHKSTPYAVVSTVADAGPAGDTGASDAGVPDSTVAGDIGPTPDSGAGSGGKVDSGAGGSDAATGCDCNVEGSTPPTWPLLALLALMLVARRRR